MEKLQKLEVTSILSWDEEHLPDELLDNLQAAGIRVVHEFNPDIRAGLTGAEAGIAETGTLVLTLEKGKPQYVSLIPEIHFAVINAQDITGDIYQAIASDKLKRASMITLISGPSRTADIEMTLTIGVHGPRQVHVFCLQD
jgi:L-lactate dehydrogenase complex protein LldG